MSFGILNHLNKYQTINFPVSCMGRFEIFISMLLLQRARWPIIRRYGSEELNFANPERLLSIRGVDSKRVQSENVATRKGF